MKSTKYKIILATSLICCCSLSLAFTVTYVNKCSYPIWLKDQASGAKSINNTILYPDSNTVKDYGASLGTYLMWPAGGCNADGSHCRIGNYLHYETMFEITVPGNYDISAVNGYTFPMSVTVPHEQGVCKNIDATNLDLAQCPSADSIFFYAKAPYSYADATFFDGDAIITKQMVELSKKANIPLKDLRVFDSDGYLTSCRSPRSAAYDYNDVDLIAWYACAYYLADDAYNCARGPSYLTKYFQAIKHMAPHAYSFPYEDGLTSVGSYSCPQTTNFIVTIGNANNPTACPNIGQVTPPPPPTTCQAPDLATFSTTKNVLNGSSITIKWATPSGSTVTGYKVFNYNNQPIGGDGNHIIYTSSYTDNTVPALAVGQQSVSYVYKVQSVCTNGDSAAITTYSTPRLIGEAEVICPTPDKNTFTVSKNKADGSSITIDWPDGGSNVTGYNIFNWHSDLIGTTNTSSYTDNTTPSLAPGQQSVPYVYQVQSICGNNKSKLSNPYSAVVTGEALKCEAPDTSTFSIMNKDHGSLIKISWAVPTNGKYVTGYKVYDWQMKALNDGNVVYPFYENQTQYSLPKLAKNQVATYWYYVQSKCFDGSSSSLSQKYIATVVGE